MNAEKNWLTQLEAATTYSDLQGIFERMSQESKAASEEETLIEKIDEAIRRIEEERSRDQAVYGKLTEDYEAFKQQQSGVVGWFKRKIPFTETRAQELEHRSAVDNQTAEILADNFIIARAQILKEKIASPKRRRMGQRPSYWREQLLNCDTVGRMQELGSLLHELIQEIASAKKFVELVSSDIDAFAGAKFLNPDEQRSKYQDSQIAKEELQALVSEVQEKETLKQAGLATLKKLLVSDLSERDSDFSGVQQRLESLKGLQDHHPRMLKLCEEHLSCLKVHCEIHEELELLPDQREKMVNEIESLKSSLQDTKERQSRAEAELVEPSRLYEAARRESQEANACLSASKLLYDAYVAEQSKADQSQAEVSSTQDWSESTAGVVQEYRRLEEAANRSAEALKLRTPPFEKAKDAQHEAMRQAQGIQKELDGLIADSQKLSEREIELRRKLSQTAQGVDDSFNVLWPALDFYQVESRRSTWNDAFQESAQCLREFLRVSGTLDHRFVPDRFGRSSPSVIRAEDANVFRTRITGMEKLLTAVKLDQSKCEREISVLAKQRKAVLERKSQMLFEQAVYSEMDFD